MHVPVVYEHEKGLFRNGPDPLKGPVVQLFLGDGGVKEMVQARVDQVFIAAPEPDTLPKQGVHRAGGVTFVVAAFPPGTAIPRASLGSAAVRHHAMRDRVQPGEDGGMRRLRGNARRKHLFAEHSLAGQPIDMRAGGQGVLIASQVIGAQRIRRDQNNIGFCLHGSNARRTRRAGVLVDIAQFPQSLDNDGLVFRPDHGRWVFRRRGGRWLGDHHILRRLLCGVLLHMPLTTLVTIAYATSRNQLPRQFSIA
jgi:hypothetical protein